MTDTDDKNTPTPDAAAKALHRIPGPGGQEVEVPYDRLKELAGSAYGLRAQREALEQQRRALESDTQAVMGARQLAAFEAQHPTHASLLKATMKSALRGDDLTPVIAALEGKAPMPGTGAPPLPNDDDTDDGRGDPPSAPPPGAPMPTLEIAQLRQKVAELEAAHQQRVQLDHQHTLKSEVDRAIAARPELSKDSDSQETARTIINALIAADPQRMGPNDAADVAVSRLRAYVRSQHQEQHDRRVASRGVIPMPPSDGTPGIHADVVDEKLTTRQAMKSGQLKAGLKELASRVTISNLNDGFGIPKRD